MIQIEKNIHNKLANGQPLSSLEAEIIATLVTQQHMTPMFIKGMEEAKYYAS